MNKMKELFNGRIGRKTFFIRSMFPAILFFLISPILNNYIVYVLLYMILAFYNMTLMIRRLHDIGHNGILAILAYVPIVNFFMSFYLLFKKGTVGENIYGPDPLV